MKEIDVILLHCSNGKNYRVRDDQVLEDFARTGVLPLTISADNHLTDSTTLVNRDHVVAVEYWTR